MYQQLLRWFDYAKTDFDEWNRNLQLVEYQIAGRKSEIVEKQQFGAAISEVLEEDT